MTTEIIIISSLEQDWSTEGYQLFMLRNQKIFSDDEHSKSDTESEPKPTQSATNQSQKPKLMHTYSNLSDKSSAATSEPPHSVRTTLVQMEFVKSSFTVNPCMVSIQPGLIQKKTNANGSTLHCRAHMRTFSYKAAINCTSIKATVCKKSTTIANHFNSIQI